MISLKYYYLTPIFYLSCSRSIITVKIAKIEMKRDQICPSCWRHLFKNRRKIGTCLKKSCHKFVSRKFSQKVSLRLKTGEVVTIFSRDLQVIEHYTFSPPYFSGLA